MTSILKVNQINDSGDNNIITSDGSGNVTLGASFPSVGKLGQVVSVTKTDTFTTSATDFTDITGLSVTITPSATSSKIFLSINVQVGGQNQVNSHLRIKRGSTVIAVGDTAGNRTTSFASTRHASDNQLQTVSNTFLDSPSTTSATTYQVSGFSTTGEFYINRSRTDTDNSDWGRSVSTITVMEILS